MVFWRPAEPVPNHAGDGPPARLNAEGPLSARRSIDSGGRRSTDGGGRRSTDGGGGLLRLPADPLGQASTLMRLVAPDAWASRGPGQEYTVRLARAVPFVLE